MQNVAVSSEFEQEEDVLSEEEQQQPQFSPDLKLFVGNLPFNVDSAELADLFGSAGTVEMVEVINFVIVYQYPFLILGISKNLSFLAVG